MIKISSNYANSITPKTKTQKTDRNSTNKELQAPMTKNKSIQYALVAAILGITPMLNTSCSKNEILDMAPIEAPHHQNNNYVPKNRYDENLPLKESYDKLLNTVNLLPKMATDDDLVTFINLDNGEKKSSLSIYNKSSSKIKGFKEIKSEDGNIKTSNIVIEEIDANKFEANGIKFTETPADTTEEATTKYFLAKNDSIVELNSDKKMVGSYIAGANKGEVLHISYDDMSTETLKAETKLGDEIGFDATVEDWNSTDVDVD